MKLLNILTFLLLSAFPALAQMKSEAVTKAGITLLNTREHDIQLEDKPFKDANAIIIETTDSPAQAYQKFMDAYGLGPQSKGQEVYKYDTTGMAAYVASSPEPVNIARHKFFTEHKLNRIPPLDVLEQIPVEYLHQSATFSEVEKEGVGHRYTLEWYVQPGEVTRIIFFGTYEDPKKQPDDHFTPVSFSKKMKGSNAFLWKKLLTFASHYPGGTIRFGRVLNPY